MGAAAFCGKGNDRVIAEYFDGKVVWVTGASGGLGEALCLAVCRLARPKGLILSARTRPELERVRRQCLELRPEARAEVLPLDLTEVDALPSAAERALQVFGGRIDVLINNGGRGFRDAAAKTGLDVDRMMMDVNYFSGVALTKALLPAWLQARHGHVVQISSIQGFIGLPGRTAYSATKHAAIGFYDSLRAEVADSGISVTVVAPGYIETNHSQNAASGSGAHYPAGHVSKATSPHVMAPQILAAVGRRRAEFIPAGVKERLAAWIRLLCPPLFFSIMRRRARKEHRELAMGASGAAQGGAPAKASKAA